LLSGRDPSTFLSTRSTSFAAADRSSSRIASSRFIDKSGCTTLPLAKIAGVYSAVKALSRLQARMLRVSYPNQKDLLTNRLSLDTTREKKAPWSLPKVDEIKMNVDAAFCADTGEAAAGVVFRNYAGEPIAAASSVLEWCTAVAVCDGVNHPLAGNPKRKV
jgi:hypothetical protein